MEVDVVIDMGREAMLQTLLLAGPPLIVALIVGAVVGLVQAITQIQDATISLVPKILAVFLTLALCLPWLVETLMDFSSRMLGTLPTFVFGG